MFTERTTMQEYVVFKEKWKEKAFLQHRHFTTRACAHQLLHWVWIGLKSDQKGNWSHLQYSVSKWHDDIRLDKFVYDAGVGQHDKINGPHWKSEYVCSRSGMRLSTPFSWATHNKNGSYSWLMQQELREEKLSFVKSNAENQSMIANTKVT